MLKSTWKNEDVTTNIIFSVIVFCLSTSLIIDIFSKYFNDEVIILISSIFVGISLILTTFYHLRFSKWFYGCLLFGFGTVLSLVVVCINSISLAHSNHIF